MIKLEKLDREEAFRYMGIKGEPPQNVLQAAEECERLILECITPKFHWIFAEIEDFSEKGVILSGHRLILSGNDIAAHLGGCCGAVLLCATLGEGADRLIRKFQAEDMAKAVITDSLASAAIEQVCDIAEEEIRRRFKNLTWRFSPGYGDFPLECQGDFLAAVNASRRVGVFLTEGGLLTPTKSVTAVIGVSETPINNSRKGCGGCNMRDKCNFRKSGGHCNG